MEKLLVAVLLLVGGINAVLAQEDTSSTPQWRPLYHFTPKKNWTNDPNGLILVNGIYHMYNQQNPFENKWGHMSWGHAVSKDLMHWQHLPIAMPETIDKDTTWRFSGCAVWDGRNSSGLCKPGGCIIAVYTADQPNLKKESQFIAYSNDGGNSFTNYDHNPVIDLNKKDFRDPNVTWNEQLNKWLMVVALPAEHKINFYASDNLKQWDLLSQFGPAGYVSANWECPSLMQLPVEGNSGAKKWVLVVSAAGGDRGVFMQYFVGVFNGKEFVNDNAADKILSVDDGDCLYAGIPWTGTSSAKKLFISWMIPAPQPTYPWRGQMSIPRDFGLRQTAAGLRLMQPPAMAIESKLSSLSAGASISLKNVAVNSTAKDLVPEKLLMGKSYWLDATVTLDADAELLLTLGTKGKDDAVKIGFKAANGQLYVDKTNAAGAKFGNRHAVLSAPSGQASSSVHLQLLLDKSSLEVFADNGEKVITTNIFQSDEPGVLKVQTLNGRAAIKQLRLWDLSGVNDGQNRTPAIMR